MKEKFIPLCWLVSGSEDETVRMWDVESGHTRLTLPFVQTNHLIAASLWGSISSYGKLISVSTSEGLKLFDSANGTLLKTLDTVFYPNGQSYCPMGHRLTAGRSDGTAEAWRLSLHNEETVARQVQIQTEPKGG